MTKLWEDLEAILKWFKEFPDGHWSYPVDAKDEAINFVHNHAAEILAMVEDSRALWGVVANAGRSRSRKARWSHVSDITALGSTRSRELCHRFDFDPDQEVPVRARKGEL